MKLLIRLLNEDDIDKVIQIPAVVRQSFERLFGNEYPERCYSIRQLYESLKDYSFIDKFNKAEWFLNANDYELNKLFFSTDFNNIYTVRGKYVRALKEMYHQLNRGNLPEISYNEKINDVLSKLGLILKVEVL